MSEKKVFPQKIISHNELMQTLKSARCIFSAQEIDTAYNQIASDLNSTYVGLNPIIIVVMRGGLVTAGQLMPKLSFLHRMDYLHATRYLNNKPTNSLLWITKPLLNIENEHVLLIDDILDEGITLKAIVSELKLQRPKSIKTCVLLNKVHDRKVQDFNADFYGLETNDLFVFGYGMDYHGYLRHLSGIFAKT